MRVMVLVKATKDSEAGIMPSTEPAKPWANTMRHSSTQVS